VLRTDQIWNAIEQQKQKPKFKNLINTVLA